MNARWGALAASLLAGGAWGSEVGGGDDLQPAPVSRMALRDPAFFDSIGDRRARSRALFLEASKVLLHPRCANCHPNGNSPLQDMDGHLHDPPVVRGPANRGAVGMACATCHQDHNVPLARVPGAPDWHLAPREMAWVGRSPSEICAQIKDPSRNGQRSLAQLHDHLAHDRLVGWAWSPGESREPAPGTQEQLGQLIAAWISTGAECPTEARP